MIEVFTMTHVEATGFEDDFISSKRVVADMSAEDAFALYTVLMNSSEVNNLTEEWQTAIRSFAKELLDAGNKCR